MTDPNTLPLCQGMLRRPRMRSLIQKGLQQPLLVLLAGPGYGKTQAVADYLSQTEGGKLWLRLSSLDNLPGHFWDHLLRVLKREYGELAAHLQTLEFPDTLPRFDAFLHLLEKQIRGQRQVIWVFDDFGEITNERIKSFFWMMAEMELPNFRLVLISSVLTSPESVAFMTKRRFVILREDLRFTREEMQELYMAYGKALEPDELRKAERCTEGWPLAVHLMAMSEDATNCEGVPEKELAHHAIVHMFEERFFTTYRKHQQMLLVKLAELGHFTKELAIQLYGGSKEDLVKVWNHPFLTNEPTTGKLSFHHIYRSFLQDKKYLLSKEEIQSLWQQAGHFYSCAGDVIDAIACYRSCGDYDSMIHVILHCAVPRYGITERNALHFLEHIDLLSPEQVKKEPMVDVIKAMCYMELLWLDQAEEILAALENRLLCSPDAYAQSCLGETYIVWGFVCIMRNREEFGEYFRRAADCLPDGSCSKGKDRIRIHNHYIFFMSDTLPGAREHMEQIVYDVVPWMNRALGGGVEGMENLFSAEAAYLCCQFADAQRHAYRTIYQAQAQGDYDRVCAGYFVLARVGLMLGDFAEMTRHVNKITEYAARYEVGSLKEVRDMALAWYYIKLRDYSRIPKSMAGTAQMEQTNLPHKRPRMIMANYLIDTREFTRVVGMLELSKERYTGAGVRPEHIYSLMMLAIGYYYLGENELAVKTLWLAYEKAYANKLFTPFVEGGSHMAGLIDLARRQHTYEFSLDWLNSISLQANEFHERSKRVRAAYKKQNPAKAVVNNPLTRREREILQALSQGLTREKISEEYYISINTVKSTIRSIYNKLDANNRAEAVSIAIARGYIMGYSPDPQGTSPINVI